MNASVSPSALAPGPETAPVSVVIPCFRCSATIGRAVQSVAAQSLRPAEVILVEDCGQDGTLNTLQEIAEAYGGGWIRVIALPRNLGLASVRNRGWEASTQPYVAFLDDDDAWHPDKIRIQYGYMRQHPEVALTGHRHRILTTGPLPFEPPPEAVTAQTIGAFPLLLSNRFIAPSVMIKRDVPLRFQEGRRHMEDHLLWLQLVLRGYRIDQLDAPLADIFKASFGEAGLSAQMMPMAKADLLNYRVLRSEGLLSAPVAALFYAWSIAKTVRRFALFGWRRMCRKIAP